MNGNWSKTGLNLALGYLVVCGILITIFGFFGETFIVLILGAPWSIPLSLLTQYYAPLEGTGYYNTVVYITYSAATLLNAVMLYWIGKLFSKL